MVENFFQTIVEITLSVSVVIVLLLLFSKLLDKNYTAKWRYWVWMVLAMRLLIPFNISLPNAPIRLYESEITTSAGETNNRQNIPPLEHTIAIEEQMIENPINEKSGDIILVNNNLVLHQNEAADYKATTARSIDMARVLSLLWISGAVLFLVYHLTVYFTYRRKTRSCCFSVKDQELLDTYYRVLKEIAVDRKTPIMICPIIKSPMVLGFLNPVLLLPDTDYSKQHLEMILRHEIIHIKRRDILYKTLILLARAVHWFNPLVHVMSVEANKDVELSCDAAVVENQNVDYRKDYSEAILMSVYKSNRSKAMFSTYFGGGKKMLKRRFASLFDLRKKRKGVISLIFVVLLIGVVGLCISCTQKPGMEEHGKSIVYENETLGFSLKLPEEWKDKYIIEESENNIDFFSKIVYEKYNGAGLLFTIVRDVGELINEQDMQQAPQPQQILIQGNGYTYYIRWPSDVQYPFDDEETSSGYVAMSNQIERVIKSIGLLGNQKPQASNKGFKVVGTGFFTLEIPDSWNIKATELPQPLWYIYDGDTKIGTIELVPRRPSSDTDGTYSIEESFLRNGNTKMKNITSSTYKIEWYALTFYDEELYRQVNLLIDYEFTYPRETLEKIENSFKFVPGPFNTVDLLTNGFQYLEQGGKRVFGTIEGFETENGEPVAVLVNTMNVALVNENTDSHSADIVLEPEIVNLNKTETYPLDMGARVVPIVSSDNGTYGLYVMPLLDSSFANNSDNYKETYYNFIVGSDGKVKMVLEQYLHSDISIKN